MPPISMVHKPSRDWGEPIMGGLVKDLYDYVVQCGASFDSDQLLRIMQEREHYRRTVNDHHVFGWTGDGEFSIQFPPLRGERPPHATRVCITGPVATYAMSVTLARIKRTMENDLRERGVVIEGEKS